MLGMLGLMLGLHARDSIGPHARSPRSSSQPEDPDDSATSIPTVVPFIGRDPSSALLHHPPVRREIAAIQSLELLGITLNS